MNRHGSLTLQLLAAGFVITGCNLQHSNAFPRSMQLVQWESLAGRECAVSRVPVMPAAGELLDTAAVLDSLRHRGMIGTTDHAAFSLVYDRRGLVRQEVIQTTLPDTIRAGLTRILDAHVTQEFTVDWNQPYWGWQLRIDMAAPPHFRVGRQEICRPQRQRSLAVIHMANAMAGRLAGDEPTSRDRVSLLVFVDRYGRARAEMLTPSVSGAFDPYAVDIIASQPYWPMLIDRIPIDYQFVDWFP